MKNFEMPKMNVAIFSLENIVTESGTQTPAQTNLEKAQAEILAQAGATADHITATTAQDWIDA